MTVSIKFKKSHDSNEFLEFNNYTDLINYIDSAVAEHEKIFICFQKNSAAFIAAMDKASRETRPVGWIYGPDEMKEDIDREMRSYS